MSAKKAVHDLAPAMGSTQCGVPMDQLRKHDRARDLEADPLKVYERICIRCDRDFGRTAYAGGQVFIFGFMQDPVKDDVPVGCPRCGTKVWTILDGRAHIATHNTREPPSNGPNTV